MDRLAAGGSVSRSFLYIPLMNILMVNPFKSCDNGVIKRLGIELSVESV